MLAYVPSNLEGLAIVEFTCREPFVTLGTFALPSDEVLLSASSCAFIKDAVREEDSAVRRTV
jgi:hypothetical protein